MNASASSVLLHMSCLLFLSDKGKPTASEEAIVLKVTSFTSVTLKVIISRESWHPSQVVSKKASKKEFFLIDCN